MTEELAMEVSTFRQKVVAPESKGHPDETVFVDTAGEADRMAQQIGNELSPRPPADLADREA